MKHRHDIRVEVSDLDFVIACCSIHKYLLFFFFVLLRDPWIFFFFWHNLFIQVCMKPGKPLTFAEILPESADGRPQKKVLAFGLPGNPVSCMVCFHLFLVPAMRHLSGWTQPRLPRFIKVVYLLVSMSISSLFL